MSNKSFFATNTKAYQEIFKKLLASNSKNEKSNLDKELELYYVVEFV